MSEMSDGGVRKIRILLCHIDRIYGVGNYDDAADDLYYCLRCVSDHAEQYPCEFDFEGKSLTLTVQGMPAVRFRRLMDLAAEHRLIEDA